MTMDAKLEKIGSMITAIPDFPLPGILFRDIFPIFKDPSAVNDLIDAFVNHIKSLNVPIDVIAGLDARGFLFGPMIAIRLGCAFVPIRKKGKLPGKVVQVGYMKEYGEDYFEMQVDAVKPGMNVVVVDDLLATGGSANAAVKLIQKMNGVVVEACFVIELDDLKGRDVLPKSTNLIRRFSSKSAHFSFFRLNAITTEDRHKSLSDIQSAVSMSNGFIHNFSLFSNYSASLSIELSSLHEVSNLAERIRSYGWNVNVTPKEIETENIKSTKPILGTVQISFVKENGDLKITVPSIPG